MNSFMAELVGTMFLILLGDGVVAAVVLNKSKAENSGWMVITTGWAMAVAMGVYAAGRISGGHINPAVTLGLAVIGKFPWSDVPKYLAAQFLGAFLGAVIVWLAYLAHWPVTEDQGKKLVVFSTAPAIRQLAHESAHRNHRNLCADVWHARHRRQRCSGAKRPRSASDRISHLGARAVARRAHRIRHESRARPRAAPCPRAAAHRGQGRFRLELCLGAGRGTGHRRPSRGSCLCTDIRILS